MVREPAGEQNPFLLLVLRVQHDSTKVLKLRHGSYNHLIRKEEKIHWNRDWRRKIMGGQKSPDRNFKPTWHILKVTCTIQGALCTEGLIGRNLSFSQILVKKEFPQVRSLYISLSFCFQILMKIPRDEFPAVWLDETSVSHRQASGSECTPSPGEQFLPSLRGKWDPYGGSGLLEFLLRKPASRMKNKEKEITGVFLLTLENK